MLSPEYILLTILISIMNVNITKSDLLTDVLKTNGQLDLPTPNVNHKELPKNYTCEDTVIFYTYDQKDKEKNIDKDSKNDNRLAKTIVDKDKEIVKDTKQDIFTFNFYAKNVKEKNNDKDSMVDNRHAKTIVDKDKEIVKDTKRDSFDTRDQNDKEKNIDNDSKDDNVRNVKSIVNKDNKVVKDTEQDTVNSKTYDKYDKAENIVKDSKAKVRQAKTIDEDKVVSDNLTVRKKRSNPTLIYSKMLKALFVNSNTSEDISNEVQSPHSIIDERHRDRKLFELLFKMNETLERIDKKLSDTAESKNDGYIAVNIPLIPEDVIQAHRLKREATDKDDTIENEQDSNITAVYKLINNWRWTNTKN